MARNTHSYAKRQREIEKKRKADEKRAKRLARNVEEDIASSPGGGAEADAAPDDVAPDDVPATERANLPES